MKVLSGLWSLHSFWERFRFLAFSSIGTDIALPVASSSIFKASRTPSWNLFLTLTFTSVVGFFYYLWPSSFHLVTFDPFCFLCWVWRHMLDENNWMVNNASGQKEKQNETWQKVNWPKKSKNKEWCVLMWEEKNAVVGLFSPLAVWLHLLAFDILMTRSARAGLLPLPLSCNVLVN